MPAARAVADDADLAVGRGQRPQRRDRRLGVAHELVVGDAARLAGGRRGVVGIDMEPLARVEVGAEGVVAVAAKRRVISLVPQSQPGR